MKYPGELLENIYWSFDAGSFTDLRSFTKELTEYNKKLDVPVNAQEVVLEVAEITVRLFHFDEEDDDEEEDDKYDDDDEDEYDDDEEEDDEDDDEEYDSSDFTDFPVKSDNNKNFTTAELLYKIHRHVSPVIKNNDFKFFEGLKLHKQVSAAPVYIILLGS